MYNIKYVTRRNHIHVFSQASGKIIYILFVIRVEFTAKGSHNATLYITV